MDGTSAWKHMKTLTWMPGWTHVGPWHPKAWMVRLPAFLLALGCATLCGCTVQTGKGGAAAFPRSAVKGLWMGDLDSFQVPKSECVQARLGSKFCRAWFVWPLGRNTASEASSVQALQQSLHFPSERRSCFHARRMQIHGEVLSHHLSYRSLEKAMELRWKTPETAKKSLHGFSDVTYNLQRMRWELCSRVKYVCTETMLRSIQPDTRASHLKPFTRLKTDAATAVVLPGEIQ